MHSLQTHLRYTACEEQPVVATLRETVTMSAFGHSRTLSTTCNAQIQRRYSMSCVWFIPSGIVRAFIWVVNFFLEKATCFWQFLHGVSFWVLSGQVGDPMNSAHDSREKLLFCDHGKHFPHITQWWRPVKVRQKSDRKPCRTIGLCPHRMVGPFKIITLFGSGLGVTVLPVTSPVTIWLTATAW